MTVNAIIEKPSINEALSNNAIIGRYVLSGEVMSMLKTLKPRISPGNGDISQMLPAAYMWV